jgi:DNA-binding CsgD family transcriptional regulator/tetratricopeptide (TPR) repeat protein
MPIGKAFALGPTGLRGRSAECVTLDQLVASVRIGESRALVLRGEAGVGKTALLDYLAMAASDLQVVRAAGMESEMELPSASVHQLCAPMLDRLGALPGPQREALEVVFGLSAGPAPDGFLVALAVLGLLSATAEQSPLLCVVDDAQWLDQASARALGFVARRLVAEHVGLVFAEREPSAALGNVPTLEVNGLRNGDARALLNSPFPRVLDERVRDRFVAETRGNPLALLELPRGMSANELAGGFGASGAKSISSRIEASYRQRLAALPPETRLLLLVAAAEPTGDPRLLWRAAERLGLGTASLGPAQVDGLLDVGGRVAFRHPLVRSAVYGSASEQDRRAVHLVLAEATDREVDPDRRVWHLASATEGPDEAVASELVDSAGRAQARGGVAAAAAFLERSVALTEAPALKAERALAAAQANMAAGAFDAALSLLATVAVDRPDQVQSARVDLLRGQIAFASSRGREAPPLLLAAAKRLERFDPDLARATYLQALTASSFAGRLANEGGVLATAHAALAAPPPPEPPGVPDLLLDGLAMLVTKDHRAGVPLVNRALAVLRASDEFAEEGLPWHFLGSQAAVAVWDFESWRALLMLHVARAYREGALAGLPMALSSLAGVRVFEGDFAAAATLVAEVEAISEAAGVRPAPYGAVVLAVYQSPEEDLLRTISEDADGVLARGEGMALTLGRVAKATFYNSNCRYEDALTFAQQAAEDPDELWLIPWILPELIEAAVRSGNLETAAQALRRQTNSTSASGTYWGRGAEARGTALLSHGDEAERLYLEAIAQFEGTPMRMDSARAKLLFGEWLRIENRRVDARLQLRAAYEMFAAIGADAFAERARRELMGAGEQVRKRSVETTHDLTPQETQIARLARDGFTNAEIGTRLFLSPRTVEWHLRKVFTKLGVGSRRELLKALPVLDATSAQRAGPG